MPKPKEDYFLLRMIIGGVLIGGFLMHIMKGTIMPYLNRKNKEVTLFAPFLKRPAYRSPEMDDSDSGRKDGAGRAKSIPASEVESNR
jgi:hypothetical protein